MEPTRADGSASTTSSSSCQSFYPFPRDFADNLSFPIGCTVLFREEHGKRTEQWKWGRVKEVGIDRHNNYDSQVCFKVQERSNNNDNVSRIVLGKNMLLAPRSRVWVVSSSKRDGNRTKQRGIVLRATTENQTTTTTIDKVQYTVQIAGGMILSNIAPKDLELRRDIAKSQNEEQAQSSTCRTTVSETSETLVDTASQTATTTRVGQVSETTPEKPTMLDRSPRTTNNREHNLPSDDHHQGDNSTCPRRIKQEDVTADAAHVSSSDATAPADDGIVTNEAEKEPRLDFKDVAIKQEEDSAEAASSIETDEHHHRYAAEPNVASARSPTSGQHPNHGLYTCTLKEAPRKQPTTIPRSAAMDTYTCTGTLEEAPPNQSSTMISTYASMDTSMPSSRLTSRGSFKSTSTTSSTFMSSSTLSAYTPNSSSTKVAGTSSTFASMASSTVPDNRPNNTSNTYSSSMLATSTCATFASMASSTVSDYTTNSASSTCSSRTFSAHANNNTSTAYSAMASAAVGDVGLSASASSEATRHASSRSPSTHASTGNLGSCTGACTLESPQKPITTTNQPSHVISYNTQANPFRHFVPGTCHRVGVALKTLKRHRQPPNNSYTEETTTDMVILKDMCLHYHVHGVCRRGDRCQWFESHRHLTPKEARDVEYAIFPVIGPEGPICSRRYQSPQQQPKRTRKGAAANPLAGSWRTAVARNHKRSDSEDMGTQPRSAQNPTRKTRRVSCNENHHQQEPSSFTPTSAKQIGTTSEIAAPRPLLGASASVDPPIDKRKDGKGTVRKAASQAAGNQPMKRRRVSIEQAPSSTATNQVLPAAASSTRYFLPVLEFGPAFFQKVLARKAERIGEKFSCVLELHGSALGRQGAEETQKRLDLFVRIVGDPSKLAPCKAAVKRTLVHAMEDNLKGFLVFRLSMINHRSENRMLMIKNPSFVGLGTDDTDARFLTCLKVKSKRSLDRVSQGLDTLECDHSSCSLDVFRRSKAFPNVKPFVLIAGANVHDVSDCQQAVERCMREH